MKNFFTTFLLLFIIQMANAQITKVTTQELYKAFKQDRVHFAGILSRFGGGGNCASVALIKASIGTFGINGVFKEVKTDSTAKMVYIKRRDDKIIVLSFDRLNFAKKHFFIKTQTDAISKKISDYAAFCFAVMCRAKQLEMGYDANYFYRGVDKLNKGQNASEIHKILGLQKVIVNDLSISNIKKYSNLVLYNAPHAVYSSNGYYDEFFNGTQTGIEPLERLSQFHCKTANGCPILGAYALK
ncbi:hypothetical protein HDC90_002201 [Pedobacter sp. AK013]|uniref:hypothetical protein n=1 Tax=Pedobacter sp. AK013 TaxID=2723071 RepID=UPI00160C830D|nr:hypothetical protein [Pedobacter sp. AK013]MBB6237579.1 hypothetical protein [Pedobacter sp. AK013]